MSNNNFNLTCPITAQSIAITQGKQQKRAIPMMQVKARQKMAKSASKVRKTTVNLPKPMKKQTQNIFSLLQNLTSQINTANMIIKFSSDILSIKSASINLKHIIYKFYYGRSLFQLKQRSSIID